MKDNKNNGKPNFRKKRGKNVNKAAEVEAENTSTSAKPNSTVLRDCTENDPMWYASNEQLLRDAFSFNAGYLLGNPISLDNPRYSPLSPASKSKFTVPGIMSLDMIPVPGASQHAASPVNLCAQKLYSFIRHANSGTPQYDKSDLMMYILALDNAYCLWNYLARLYGVMRTYNQYNRYMPHALVKAMNVDFNSIFGKLDDLRSLVNEFSSGLSTFAVPGTLPYITRHSWLFSNVFSDSESVKAQLYMYNPSFLFKFVEVTEAEQLPYLEPVMIKVASSEWRLDGLQGLVREFLDPLTASTDMGNISADILKAFGDANLIRVPFVGEDYQVIPAYSPEVLMQIENAKSAGQLDMASEGNRRITQTNEEWILFAPKVHYDPARSCDYNVYNFHVDGLTPADYAVATRFNGLLNWDDVAPEKPGDLTTIGSCGSEYLQNITVYQYDITNPAKTLVHGINTAYNIADPGTGVAWSVLSCFKYCPIVTLYSTEGSDASTTYKIVGVASELDNYTVISSNDLEKANRIALLSLFNVPGVASVLD